jgi:co-chaperonin GroES (HSP10)
MSEETQSILLWLNKRDIVIELDSDELDTSDEEGERIDSERQAKGTVIAVGKKVKNIKEGDRVIFEKAYCLSYSICGKNYVKTQERFIQFKLHKVFLRHN